MSSPNRAGFNWPRWSRKSLGDATNSRCPIHYASTAGIWKGGRLNCTSTKKPGELRIMSTLPNAHSPFSSAEQLFSGDKEGAPRNRRAILLELARLIGERNVVGDRLTWLDKHIALLRNELQNFDQA